MPTLVSFGPDPSAKIKKSPGFGCVAKPHVGLFQFYVAGMVSFKFAVPEPFGQTQKWSH